MLAHYQHYQQALAAKDQLITQLLADLEQKQGVQVGQARQQVKPGQKQNQAPNSLTLAYTKQFPLAFTVTPVGFIGPAGFIGRNNQIASPFLSPFTFPYPPCPPVPKATPCPPCPPCPPTPKATPCPPCPPCPPPTTITKTVTNTVTVTTPPPYYAPITLAVVSNSTVVTLAQVQAAAAALQIQITRDFAQYYPVGNYVTVKAITAAQAQSDLTSYLLYISDNSDEAGALGYHTLNGSNRPVGYVFAKTDQQYGYNWTVTLSHEALELLGNAYVSNLVENTDTTAVPYELADPVQDDSDSYSINGIKVSDFVTPNWFFPVAGPAGTKYDFMNHCTAPGQILPYGYMSVLDLNTGNWTQIYGQQVKGKASSELKIDLTKLGHADLPDATVDPADCEQHTRRGVYGNYYRTKGHVRPLAQGNMQKFRPSAKGGHKVAELETHRFEASHV